MVGNSNEAKFLDDLISTVGQDKTKLNRGAVQAKLSYIMDGLQSMGSEQEIS